MFLIAYMLGLIPYKIPVEISDFDILIVELIGYIEHS